ncbi:MAG: DUF1828 domain-containing protein [Allosphingosinicella sp.]
MKEALCRAFCGDLTLTDVPVGYAVSTTFRRDDGDAVGFYIVRDAVRPGFFRLEDDGTTIPFLEEAGVEFSTEARSEAFAALLESHKIEFNEDEMLLHTQPLREADIPASAMRFVSFMLRVNDFLLLTRDKITSTFKEDAAEMLRVRIGDRADIQEGIPVTPAMADNVPDVVVRAAGRRPVAVFFGSSPQRVYDAVLLQMQALYEAQEDVAVIALLENDGIISRELRRRATNRLTALPSFRGDEFEAIHRIEREALGSLGATRH